MPGSWGYRPAARRALCITVSSIALSMVAAQAASKNTAVAPGSGDSIRCPTGVVRIAEIQAIVQDSRTGGKDQTLGAASLEICADNETKYIDIVTHGAPDDVANNGQQGQKSGIDGSIQIHGRTAQLNTNVYIPLSEADLMQCGHQDETQQEGACKPHAQVASFTGTWVFTLGKWATFRTGADTAGNPVYVAARILNGPVE